MGLGFWGFAFRVQGLGSRIQGFGFRVSVAIAVAAVAKVVGGGLAAGSVAAVMVCLSWKDVARCRKRYSPYQLVCCFLLAAGGGVGGVWFRVCLEFRP